MSYKFLCPGNQSRRWSVVVGPQFGFINTLPEVQRVNAGGKDGCLMTALLITLAAVNTKDSVSSQFCFLLFTCIVFFTSLFVRCFFFSLFNNKYDEHSKCIECMCVWLLLVRNFLPCPTSLGLSISRFRMFSCSQQNYYRAMDDEDTLLKMVRNTQKIKQIAS